MQRTTHVIGIDPGLVDTGVVQIQFMPDARLIRVNHTVIKGPGAQPPETDPVGPRVQEWIVAMSNGASRPRTFVEGYRPRSTFGTDVRMVELVKDVKAATNGEVINNTGVKKVVRQPLMELIGVWRFGTTTHLQDLRAAGRIALFGMLKHKDLNAVVYGFLRDNLDGKAWRVIR
jgi:hypothetical protein